MAGEPSRDRGRPGRARRPAAAPTSPSGTRRRGERSIGAGDRSDRAGDGPDFRSGFACFVGRPNAGKSTLTNALVGTKIAIASSKPQTTRHAIRGIVHRPDAQLVLIDTPGLHKPRTLLGERLNDVVRATWTEVDVIGVCLPANQKIGPGDTYLVGEIAKLPKQPALVAIATKSDLVSREPDGRAPDADPAARRRARHQLDRDRPGVGHRRTTSSTCSPTLWSKLLPEGPPLYPDGEITDEPEETLVAELIREAALEGVRDELPHSITVMIEEMGLREGRADDKPLLDIYASMVVERDSQKGIVIGHRGSRLREIGAAARKQIEALLGTPVYLDLRVKVIKEWQRDAKHLNRLGF